MSKSPVMYLIRQPADSDHLEERHPFVPLRTVIFLVVSRSEVHAAIVTTKVS